MEKSAGDWVSRRDAENAKGVRNDVWIMYIDRALRTDAGHDTLRVNFAYELHAGSSRSRTAHAS